MTRPDADIPSWDADTCVTELYAAHWQRLVRLSVLLVGDLGTAEEVVQDAFVDLHGRWSRLRQPDRALAYLRQSVVNRSRSVLRHRGVERKFAPRLVTDESTPDHAADSHDADRDAVLRALRALPDRQREVVALRYYLDLSEAEIAAALDISPGTVKSHASRGLAALRTSLSDPWEEPS